MNWDFIGRVSFGFLTGAALAAVALGILTSGFLLAMQMPDLHPLMLLMIPFVMQIAFLACSVVFMMNAPIVLLFAYLYRSSLVGGVAIGATAGGIEAYWLSAWFDRPNYGGNELLAFLGAVGGAIIAWRVWTEVRLPTTAGWLPPAPSPPRSPTGS